jgi:hypothetical protein
MAETLKFKGTIKSHFHNVSIRCHRSSKASVEPNTTCGQGQEEEITFLFPMTASSPQSEALAHAVVWDHASVVCGT